MNNIGELVLGGIIAGFYLILMCFMWPTTETKPVIWIIFSLIRIPYGIFHILDAVQSDPSFSFSTAFACLDLVALPILSIGIVSVGPPAIAKGQIKRYLQWGTASLPPLILIVSGAVLQVTADDLINNGKYCWKAAAAYLTALSAAAAGFFVLAPCFASRDFKDYQRQAYISVPILVRCSWALSCTIRKQVYTPKWTSPSMVQHIILAIAPEFLATVAFVATTWHTRRAIATATRLPVRELKNRIHSTNIRLSGVPPPPPFARQLTSFPSNSSINLVHTPPFSPHNNKSNTSLNIMPIDDLPPLPPLDFVVSSAPPLPPRAPIHTAGGVGMSSITTTSASSRPSSLYNHAAHLSISSTSSAKLPSHSSHSNSNTNRARTSSPTTIATTTSTPIAQHPRPKVNWTPYMRDTLASVLSTLHIPPGPLSSASSPQYPSHESPNWQRRRLATVLVAAAYTNVDYPLTRSDIRRLRRKLDFFLTSSAGAWGRELVRLGWHGVGGLVGHRRAVVGALKDALNGGDGAATTTTPGDGHSIGGSSAARAEEYVKGAYAEWSVTGRSGASSRRVTYIGGLEEGWRDSLRLTVDGSGSGTATPTIGTTTTRGGTGRRSVPTSSRNSISYYGPGISSIEDDATGGGSGGDSISNRIHRERRHSGMSVSRDSPHYNNHVRSKSMVIDSPRFTTPTHSPRLLATPTTAEDGEFGLDEIGLAVG